MPLRQLIKRNIPLDLGAPGVADRIVSDRQAVPASDVLKRNQTRRQVFEAEWCFLLGQRDEIAGRVSKK